MAILRTEKMVPYVYPNESRDFQLLLRYYDYLVNGIKHDIDKIEDVIDTQYCNSKILYLLQSKVGFFSSAKITDDELRYVLSAFPYIIRNKGSLKSIGQAVNVFCKVKKITTGYKIIKYNTGSTNGLNKEEIDELEGKDFVILIEIFSSFQDTTILDEIFRYILPPTYQVIYMFMSATRAKETEMHLGSEIRYQHVNYDDNMVVYGGNNVPQEDDLDSRLGTAISGTYFKTFTSDETINNVGIDTATYVSSTDNNRITILPTDGSISEFSNVGTTVITHKGEIINGQ